MKICAQCFEDEEIRKFISASSSITATCDCCSLENVKVVDLNELSDFFIELLHLFVKDNTGNDLIPIIQNDWRIFQKESYAYSILSYIMSHENFDFSIDDKVAYNSEIQECFSVWDNLKLEVQEKKRYFSDISTFNWEVYIKSNAKISKGNIFYRARITPNGRTILDKNEMGCPPKELATAGRANPLGIPYLYLCRNFETTFYEVRAVYLDKVSIGEFEIIHDLNIVDFSSKINLFYTYTDSDTNENLSDTVKRKIILDKISHDLSKPLRRFDTEIEYVPTQLICEYCKQNGADGIQFNSSLHQGGVNVVLFNPSDAQCVGVSSWEIKKVIIEGA